ncbi:hypothetical protein OG735_05460 [Streptomyces sp. NBC_01210]|uniref:hypothetical protein n=1 Tax=Streptomyces sp. NBC_01210 TaxID=2903774 RepID=UPI002E102CE6|nr:hypothetical protein OG735_05460 [Streptomyces sp. NBC_01210]
MAGELLIPLASSGAAALVAAAATDAWQTARTGFLRLLGQGDPRRERLAASRLDEAAARIEGAADGGSGRIREELFPVWRTRLTDLMQEHPEVVDQLRALTHELRATLPADHNRWAEAVGTGQVFTANSGGVNVANTGVMGDIRLPDTDQ